MAMPENPTAAIDIAAEATALRVRKTLKAFMSADRNSARGFRLENVDSRTRADHTPALSAPVTVTHGDKVNGQRVIRLTATAV